MVPWPTDGEEDRDYYRRQSMFVFAVDGHVSQFQGRYPEYFTALEAGEGTTSGFTK